MASIATTTAALIRRFGRACVVTTKALGSGSNAQAAATLNSSIRIGNRTTTVVAGQLTSAVNAIMPADPLVPSGARVAVAGRTYTVQSVTQVFDQTGACFKQNLVLT